MAKKAKKKEDHRPKRERDFDQLIQDAEKHGASSDTIYLLNGMYYLLAEMSDLNAGMGMLIERQT